MTTAFLNRSAYHFFNAEEVKPKERLLIYRFIEFIDGENKKKTKPSNSVRSGLWQYSSKERKLIRSGRMTTKG